MRLITRVVDYGGLFWGDVAPATSCAEQDHRRSAPRAGSRRARQDRPRSRRSRRTGLTPIQLACCWNLAQPAVDCVAPTLIQEIGSDARSIEDKRAELAALPETNPLSDADLAEIRAIGDNTGSMLLKGASPEHEGEPRPDRWPLDEQLAETARRWGIEPARDLVKLDG